MEQNKTGERIVDFFRDLASKYPRVFAQLKCSLWIVWFAYGALVASQLLGAAIDGWYQIPETGYDLAVTYAVVLMWFGISMMRMHLYNLCNENRKRWIKLYFDSEKEHTRFVNEVAEELGIEPAFEIDHD